MPTPTYTDTTVKNLVISKLSQETFDELKAAGLLNENELYLVENETLDAMGNVVKNVGTPVQSTDAANKGYVDGNFVPMAGNATITGNIDTTADLYHVENITGTCKNVEWTNDDKNYFSTNVVTTYMASDASKLTDTSADRIPMKMKGTLVSTGQAVSIDVYLTNPVEHTSDIVYIKWDIIEVASGTNVGNISFYGNGGAFPAGTSQGQLSFYGDYILGASYNADTTETFGIKKSYVYEVPPPGVTDLHYPLVVKTLEVQTISGVQTQCATLDDLAINNVTVTDNTKPVQLTFPVKTSGKARDFILRLEITTSTAPSVVFVFQNGEDADFESMEDWTSIESGVTLLSFTETK